MTTDAELRSLLDRLFWACETDFALREAVRTLVERVLDGTPEADSVQSHAGSRPYASPAEPERSGQEPSVDSSVSGPSFERTDLSLVARRLRLKADGARWAAERRCRLSNGADYAAEIEPNDREIIRRAKEIPGCYLWTNAPNSPSPRDLTVFETLARCYENAAKAAEIVHDLDALQTPSGPNLQQAFGLLAEAQSALRLAVRNAEGPEDPDQYEIFQWLKHHTRARAIYVARHMRVNDPADPDAWQALTGRLEAFEKRLETT
ncbi:MAG TPA: hypothetical protein VGN57_21345 [Pirellulaceae bacterium]|jgi:hypothetical protein|nr:hypothetical protein [Pirellulaceae bacterium]